MCFRPAVVKNICPACGADNFPGVKECIQCGGPLDGGHEPEKEPMKPAAPAPASPAAPEAPKAPKAD